MFQKRLVMAVLAGWLVCCCPVLSKVLPEVESLNPVIAIESGGAVAVEDLQGIVAEEGKSPFKAWIKGDSATGDWMGLRSGLEERGIIFESEYIIDSSTKTHGGIHNRKHPFKYMGLINTSAEVNTKKLGLWRGGRFFANFINLHGNGLTNNYVGDLQGISNIDAKPHAQLIEYWYEQSLFDGRIRVKGGKQDANAEFCALESAGDFVNSSFGLVPNVPIPAYPSAGLGVLAAVSPVDYFDVKYGFFDGAPEIRNNAFKPAFDGKNGAVHIAEVSLKPNINGHHGNYIAGYWFHTGDVEEITVLDGARSFRHNQGFYAGLDQKVFNERLDRNQGLSLIGQFGFAPSNRNDISRYYGAGLKYSGLMPGRNDDITGMGLVVADVSRRYRDIDNRSRESVIEFYHKAQLTGWFALQPDFQYIFSPGGGGKDAFALGLRTVFTF